jgi:hypothetical protein
MNEDYRRQLGNYSTACAAIALPTAALCLTPPTWPRWLFMWLLAVAVFSSCKLITWNAARGPTVPLWRHLAYLFAWPGLDAPRFLDPQRQPQPPSMGEWIAGALQTLLGVLLFWNAHRIVSLDSPFLLAWVGMIGVALMLHFGSFKLMSCAWRSVGVDARPLMNAPLRSTSVSEFWGKRWNTAFRDITFQFLFRPLARRLNASAALIIAFLFSGAVHDLVVSVPAHGGYGLPTLFFVIQAVAMNIEKSHAGRRLGLGSGWRGWLFTAIALLAPARLLFHDPFLKNVVIPFMSALGAA